MTGASSVSLQALLDLFPDALVELSLLHAGGEEITCSVFQVGEVAALAAALRLGGWQASRGHQVGSDHFFPHSHSRACFPDLENPNEDGLPGSVTDLF